MFMWMLYAPPLNINKRTIHEVDRRKPTRPSRAASKALPPRTRYTPSQPALKALTRAHKHPFAHWSESSSTSKSAEFFLISETLYKHCAYKEDDRFFSLIDSEMLEAGLATGLKSKYTWVVGPRLLYRLGKEGDERDSAAHHEYSTLMNERSLMLIDLCVEILRGLSKK